VKTMGGNPLDPIQSISPEDGIPSSSLSTTLPFPWKKVVQAYNSRFPTHPSFPYVKGTTVPYQEVLPNKEEQLTRIVDLDMGFPAWLKKTVGMEVFQVREDVAINEKERTMKLRTTNLTFYDKVRIYEECTYREHPDNPAWTQKELTAYLDIVYCRYHFCYLIKNKVESFARDKYIARAQNAVKEELALLNGPQ